MQDRSINCYKYKDTSNLKPEKQNIVFISYKREPDRAIAHRCVKIIYDAELHHWIDDDHIESEAPDIKIAGIIEEGLDAASALLGIIGPQTLDSSWPPYETGGARGRQRFNQRFDRKYWYQEGPHPLIAHFIHGTDITDLDLPAFIKLGVPLCCLCEVEQWAAYIADILKHKSMSSDDVYGIQNKHKILDLYNRISNF